MAIVCAPTSIASKSRWGSFFTSSDATPYFVAKPGPVWTCQISGGSARPASSSSTSRSASVSLQKSSPYVGSTGQSRLLYDSRCMARYSPNDSRWLSPSTVVSKASSRTIALRRPAGKRDGNAGSRRTPWVGPTDHVVGSCSTAPRRSLPIGIARCRMLEATSSA
jgi:hypothetical protein